jgi:type VI secretion system protein ImpA
MRYDWLFEPVSEAEPCGPDLDEVGDDKYLNYVLAVGSRIPERYFRSDTGKAVDRAEVKLKDEVETIGALLKESRDLRLLCIEARFQSFAGELPGFADCIEAIAGLLARFWEDVHPKATDGDLTLRQNGLSGLDDFGQVIQPLQHAPLVRDRRLGGISLRQYLVGTGAAAKRPDEIVPEVGEIQRSLASDENRALSDASYDAILRASKALTQMREAFIEKSGYDYVPNFDRLAAFLDQLLQLFRASRPELEATAQAAEQEAAAAEEDGADAAAQATAAPRPSAATGAVASHADAAAALLAVEEYYATHEPSTPSLILIHQARLLVGKPLIQTLEILLPEAAPRAMIRIQGEINVQLSMAQLKQLTAGVPKLANGANSDAAAAKSFAAATRAEAMTLMVEVEYFYKSAEPSSPVPMLLAKASGYFNRDFTAILKDLIPPPPVAEKPPEKK